jgi:hypothetical protein
MVDSFGKSPSLQVGQIVVFYQGDQEASLGNGAMKHPAIITRVWGPDMVNLTVFPDCGSVTDRTSVPRAFHGGNSWGFVE